MKQHIEAVKAALKAVLLKQGQQAAVESLAQHLKGVELEAGFRINTIKQLDEMLEGGKLPIDLHTETVQILLGNRTKTLKFTTPQCANLAKIRDIINNAVAMDCEHKGLKVIALMYGGGFTPNRGLPELFCPDCTLNVTVAYSKAATLRKALGISIPVDLLAELREWAKAMYLDRTVRVISSREMSRDPAEVFKNSVQFEGDLSIIKIINKKLFESMSGV